ncbi:hypothetical protein CLV91_0505 [Maribacter vaceletii]|uniref:Receptor L domain-containing protein n=1 Tax=Maribacter vaceletii TaxID=1206816 RepID=A0A495EC41_9FLAO|nr:hypothetical protein [Maribacter vaceletii]RKR14430.1 hypothetical protein CLV91_0505 [Maribacter vaceletii]
MKKIFGIILLTFLFNCSNDDAIVADKTFEGDVTLTTQREVDDFGDKNITHINGILTIGGNVLETTDILELKKLENLKSALSIYITYNNELRNLNGLGNITASGQIIISNNPALVSLKGLEKISEAAVISIRHNVALINLEGLNGIVNLSSSLNVVDNYNLKSLNGLTALKSTKWLHVVGNAIENLNGLESLEEVENFFIERNNSCLNLNGLSSLTSIKGELVIIGNIALSNFCGLKLGFMSNYNGEYLVNDNAYNPTLQNLKDEDCKL